MSVLMRRENTLIIEPGSDISKIQIINFILLPNSKKHFEGPPLYSFYSIILLNQQKEVYLQELVWIHLLILYYQWIYTQLRKQYLKVKQKLLMLLKDFIDFPKQPNCTLFCDNYYGTIDVVEYIKSIGLEYVGTFRPSRLGKELSQNLEKLQLNQVVQYPVFKEVKLKKTTKQVLVKDVNVLQWQCKKQKILTMIYTKSKFVKQPCQMQEFVSSRGIPREQPEIVRYYNNNYKGVDYVDQLTKNIKFPGRCTRWTTRMFIYFMQVILVNGFSLMKLLHPEYKEIKITDYVESIIDQMKINLTKYEIKATPRKIEGCNQPVVSPIKGPVIEAYKHYHVYTKVSAQCVGCKQCNSRYVCSCKGYHLCPECYKTHISEQNDIRGYTHIYKK
ncbi:Transposase_IS4 [Hexamita inflata]|uniref:Transposase IS4 n=1 Tax=Hexamita inflata TaxID=28002 RepID=A0AA86P481_9EUKA|nr:Transposase IS4 [Hexamita inflata]